MFQIIVPSGVRPGQTIRVKVPAPAPAPQQQQQHQQVASPVPRSPASVPLERQSSGEATPWTGWFLKQQPNFPHAWQKRYGKLVRRSGSWNTKPSPSSPLGPGFELVYYTNEVRLQTRLLVPTLLRFSALSHHDASGCLATPVIKPCTRRTLRRVGGGVQSHLDGRPRGQ